jgi:uncharacterized membrane protein
MGIVAVVFGLLTIKTGGQVLFGDEVYREAAGNYIPLVLWFNFMAGFAYLIAGIGLMTMKKWAIVLSGIIAGLTMFIFVALGIHIYMGGDYETRTVAAMALRSTVWTVIFILAYRQLMCR